jgi:hypothetical protein
MKTQINFTELEKQVLRNYFSKGINFDFLPDNSMTLFELCARILTNEGQFVQLETLKGVIGSLSKKNIIECEDYDNNGSNLICPSSNYNWTKESFEAILSSLN